MPRFIFQDFRRYFYYLVVLPSKDHLSEWHHFPTRQSSVMCLLYFIQGSARWCFHILLFAVRRPFMRSIPLPCEAVPPIVLFKWAGVIHEMVIYLHWGGSPLDSPSPYIAYLPQRGLVSLCLWGGSVLLMSLEMAIFISFIPWGGSLCDPCRPVKSLFTLECLIPSFLKSLFFLQGPSSSRLPFSLSPTLA